MNKMNRIGLGFGALSLAVLFSLVMLHLDVLSQWDNKINQSFSGQKTVLPSGKPQRIVSMSPGNTEILFALGAGDRVVGVTSYSDYPAEAKTKTSIGGYHTPDVEKILSLAPDLVVAMGGIQAEYIRMLAAANIPVIAVEPKTLPEILTAIDVISAAIGEPERGAALHNALGERLDQVRRITRTLPPRRVFVEVWDAPLLTVGRQSFINDMIIQAGGVNVAAVNNIDYAPCNIEALYAYNPEVYIIISHNRNDMRSLIQRPELSDIAAVKTKQIFSIVDDIVARPGPRCFEGLAHLAGILHPEAFGSQDKATM